MSPEQQSARAARAKQIIDNEIWQEAFPAVRQQIINEWCSTKPSDVGRMVELRHMLGLLDQLRLHLMRVFLDGIQVELNAQYTRDVADYEDAMRKFNSSY